MEKEKEKDTTKIKLKFFFPAPFEEDFDENNQQSPCFPHMSPITSLSPFQKETFKSALTPILSRQFFPSEINLRSLDDLSPNDLRLRSTNESKTDVQGGESATLIGKKHPKSARSLEFGQFHSEVNNENDPDLEKKLYERFNSIRRNL